MTFTGKVAGDELKGTLDMGEYLGATWTARGARTEGLMRSGASGRGVGLIGAVIAGFGLGAAVTQRRRSPAAPKYDLLLRGGHVIDARNAINAVRDVAIAAGKIAAVAREASIPRTRFKTVDVTGLYVTPGLIDIHAHVYTGTGEPRLLRRATAASTRTASRFASA